MKKKSILIIVAIAIAVAGVVILACSIGSLDVHAVTNIKRILKNEKIPYSDVSLNGKQMAIDLTSNSAERCSEQDLKNLMFIFQAIANEDNEDSFDEVQIKITDPNGKVIYNNIQRVLFSESERVPKHIEKIEDTCKKIENLIAEKGVEVSCQYSVDDVFDVPRVNFVATYDNPENNVCDFSPSYLYDMVASEVSSNYNIGYCTLQIKKNGSNEADIYLEGDYDLNLLLSWISPEISSRIGPPSEEQFAS